MVAVLQAAHIYENAPFIGARYGRTTGQLRVKYGRTHPKLAVQVDPLG